MASLIRKSALAFGVSLLALAVLGDRPAHAGSVGIVIKSGGTAPVGDPLYNYYFNVDLAAGYTLQTGGYFTVYDIPGVAPGALTAQPNLYWGASIQELGVTPTGTPTITDSPTIENVTWQYNGAGITAGSSAVDLGTFIVQTVNLSSQPTPTLLYVGSLGNNTYTDQGTVIVNAIVPEPASIILLGSAAFMAPVFLVVRSRRRNMARAQTAS